jgi:hypothetical protein
MGAFLVVAVGGWFLLMAIEFRLAPDASDWQFGILILAFMAWVFVLTWICRGGWLLGVSLGFICGFSVAAWLGAIFGPCLGLIAGIAVMPLTGEWPRRAAVRRN